MMRIKQVISDKFLNFLSVIPKIFLITSILLSISFSAEGHPGDTDDYGCHYDRQGRYHCH